MDKGILCQKCGKRYPPSEMKYLHDSKNMQCINCINKAREAQGSGEPLQKGALKKTRYKCLRCKHVFMLKDGFSKICPFCSSQNLSTQDWNSDLDNLISESGQRIYDN